MRYADMTARQLAAELRRPPRYIPQLFRLAEAGRQWTVRHRSVETGSRALLDVTLQWRENRTHANWLRVEATAIRLAEQFDELGDEPPPPFD